MVDNEVQEQLVEAAATEQIQTNPGKQPEVVENTPVKQPFEDSAALEQNIRSLRQAKERALKERDEMERRLREYETKATPQPAEEDFSLNIGESDLVEGKDLSRVQKQQAKREKDLREEMLKTQQQLQNMVIETRLKTECPDIDKVVSKDNMDMLAELHPEIAETIRNSTNYYSQAKSAYTLIKKLGIHKEDAYANDRAQAQVNASKPKPLASISPQTSDTPLSHANVFANGLTEELKAQLRKEMEDASRNY